MKELDKNDVIKLLDELIVIARDLDVDQMPLLYDVIDEAEEILNGLRKGEITLVSEKKKTDEKEV